MAVLMEPEKRIDVFLRNLPELCCDIINKKNRRMDSLPMGYEDYLEEKRENLIRIAESIGDEKARDTAKIKINGSFEKAREYLWQEYDGKEFNVMDRDLI